MKTEKKTDFKIPGTNLQACQAKKGMIPWWMTWRVETLSNFFRAKKKKVSKNSVNLLKKYHHAAAAIRLPEIHQRVFKVIFHSVFDIFQNTSDSKKD
jgi:hypothetical protein